jgi:heparanase
VWTADQARRFLAYTRSVGGTIAAAEFFNEPSDPAAGGAPPGYDAANYARDFAIFRQFSSAAAPDMRIVGPGSAGEGIRIMRWPLLATADLLAAHPRPVFDIFSYHSDATIAAIGALAFGGRAVLVSVGLSSALALDYTHITYNEIAVSGSLWFPRRAAGEMIAIIAA